MFNRLCNVIWLKNYSYYFQFISSDLKQLIINAYRTKIARQPNMKKEDLRKIMSNELGIGQRTISTTIYQYELFKTISSPNRKKIKNTYSRKSTISIRMQYEKRYMDFGLKNKFQHGIKF